MIATVDTLRAELENIFPNLSQSLKIITHDISQLSLHQGLDLLHRELHRRLPSPQRVEEPVPELHGLKLRGQDAVERIPHQPVFVRLFQKSRREQVNVARRLVQFTELGPVLELDLRGRLGPRAHLGQAAQFSVLVVAGDAVFAASLYVPGDEVAAQRVGEVVAEEEAAEVVHHAGAERLRRELHHAEEDLDHALAVVQVVACRVEKVVSEEVRLIGGAAGQVQHADEPVHHGVSEAEGSRRELCPDRGVERRVVLVAQ